MTLKCSVHIVMAVLLSSAGVSVASPQPPAEKPPLLSTVPSPPAGITPVPADMSGQPLQVGDLPPGVLVIRVIRRTFAGNLPGQRVRIQVGTDTTWRDAATDETGRARFDGLRIGDTVRVSGSVDGESLGSNSFVIPGDGGVRMLLVAGVGAGALMNADATRAPESRPGAGTGRQPAATRTTVVVDASTIAITLFAMTGMAILWSLRPRSANRKSATSASDSH